MAFLMGNQLGDSLPILLAESCSGGLIATSLTDIRGSSEALDYCGVVYSNNSKVRDLGVSRETLEEHSAVSSEVCKEMLNGLHEKNPRGIYLATTGYIEPADAETCRVYIGLKCKDAEPVVSFFELSGRSRNNNKLEVACKALQILKDALDQL